MNKVLLSNWIFFGINVISVTGFKLEIPTAASNKTLGTFEAYFQLSNDFKVYQSWSTQNKSYQSNWNYVIISNNFEILCESNHKIWRI